jgi:hypothetical protein
MAHLLEFAGSVVIFPNKQRRFTLFETDIYADHPPGKENDRKNRFCYNRTGSIKEFERTIQAAADETFNQVEGTGGPSL